jgi:hypothetical protein
MQVLWYARALYHLATNPQERIRACRNKYASA